MWRPSGGASWVLTQLDGKTLNLKEAHEWPQKMPLAGTLKVNVVRSVLMSDIICLLGASSLRIPFVEIERRPLDGRLQ